MSGPLRTSFRFTLLTLFLLPGVGVSPLSAQDTGKVTDQARAAAPATGETPARKSPETLLELIVAGGPLNIGFLLVLGLFSLLALAVILERLTNLTVRKLMPPDFVRGLQELIRRKEDDPRMFRELCERHPSTIATILKAGVLRAGRPLPEVEKAMEDAAARELGVLAAASAR